MTSRTSLLEFKFMQDTENHLSTIQKIQNVLREVGLEELTNFQMRVDNMGVKLEMRQYFSPDKRCHCTVRLMDPGLVTVDIHEYVPEGLDVRFTNEDIKELKKRIDNVINSSRAISLPAIRRGLDVEVYFPTVDDKLIEYDFDKTIYHERSQYQDIRIMHSHQFGNMLLLDDDPNLAESDLSYTKAITGFDQVDYAGKTILILGGGDGGILHELRQYQPAYITMLEIDQVVIEQARIHLRGVCHGSLDQLTGDNYQVLISDCIPILKQYQEEGRQFDYIINDLTAIPITTQPEGSSWDFMRLILDISLDLLHPDGRYFTQGNSVNMPDALAMYENHLKSSPFAIDFRRFSVCVPSYHEMWIFYEIWKINKTSDKDNCTSIS